MQSKKTRRLAWLAIPLSLAIFAAACGDDDDKTSSGDSGGSTEENISGSINITGSSTVEPISSLVGEEFSTEYPDVDVAVEGPGTGDGFATFCKGENDITDASRTIKDEEKTICDQNGVEYIELKIGFDGITVMTNANNDDVECLSFADLYALIGPESNDFAEWSDAQALANELGSSTQFPDGSWP